MVHLFDFHHTAGATRGQCLFEHQHHESGSCDVRSKGGIRKRRCVSYIGRIESANSAASADEDRHFSIKVSRYDLKYGVATSSFIDIVYTGALATLVVFMFN